MYCILLGKFTQTSISVGLQPESSVSQQLEHSADPV